jgi:hypothetical protein
MTDRTPIEEQVAYYRARAGGREFRVVKMFYEPDDLKRRLQQIGLSGWVRSTGRFLHYGCVSAAIGPSHHA